MAHRATELTLENINRVLFMIQKDMAEVKPVVLPSGELVTTVDLSPITGTLDRVIVRVSVLERDDEQTQAAMALKADKTNTVNAYPIGNNPILAGTDLLMGNGDQDTVYEAVKAAQSIFNIVGSAPTYAALPNPSTVASGGVYVVLQDETRNNQQTLYRRTAAAQWLFTGIFAINLSAYYTKGEADALYAQNSAQDQAYADGQVSMEALERNSAIAAEHSVITTETENTVSASAQALQTSLLQTLEFRLSNYVPNTRQINGKSLYADITIDTTNIQYNGQTLAQFLGTVTGALLYKGSVDTAADLPDPAGLQDGLLYNVLDTMSLMITSEGTWQYFGKVTINLSDYYKKEETYSRDEVDANVAEAKEAIENDLNANVTQLNANIAAAQVNAVTAANGYTDGRIDNDIVPELEQYTKNAVATLKQYVENNKVDKTFTYPFVSDIAFSPDADSVIAKLTRYYLNTSGKNVDCSMPMVSNDTAGFMPAADHYAISDLQRRVESLEAAGVYIGQSFATYAEMMGTPINPSWTVNDFTFVQDDESHSDHATEYILIKSGSTLAWVFARYDDIDIPAFTASTPGIITSSSADGFITGDNKHQGSVSGWAELKTRVINAEKDITTLNTNFTNQVPVTSATSGNEVTLTQNAKTIISNLAKSKYVDEAVSDHAKLTGRSYLGHVTLASNPGAVNIEASGALSHLSGEGYSHIPSGGSNGQALKIERDQYGNFLDYYWNSLREVPSDGTNGQFLRRGTTGTNYAWANISQVPDVSLGKPYQVLTQDFVQNVRWDYPFPFSDFTGPAVTYIFSGGRNIFFWDIPNSEGQITIQNQTNHPMYVIYIASAFNGTYRIAANSTYSQYVSGTPIVTFFFIGTGN